MRRRCGDVPGVPRRKGGNLPGVELAAEATDQVAYAVIAVAQGLCDVLHRSVLDEDSAEDLVATVHRVGGLEEEGRVAGIVHGPASGCGVFSEVSAAPKAIVGRQAEDRPRARLAAVEARKAAAAACAGR
jgi:hypothetical protein